MLIVNKTVNEVGFICEDYNGFTDEKEEEVAKIPIHLGVTTLYLRDAWADWNETLRVYRVHLKLVQRHIFNFRSGSQTGNGLPHP